MLIVVLNSRLKTGDVQSGLATDTNCSRRLGRGTGSGQACGLEPKKDCMLKRDRLSAAQFVFPGMCSILRFTLKTAVKNHRTRSKYDTVASLADPFLTAATTPVLSH